MEKNSLCFNDGMRGGRIQREEKMSSRQNHLSLQSTPGNYVSSEEEANDLVPYLLV